MSLKLQFGAGGNLLHGWENHDADIDVTKPLPFADVVADTILAEHLGEHLDSGELLRFLTECHRILKPQGTMRLCCPATGPWLTREHARDLATGHGHRLVLTEDVMRTFLWMAGFELTRIRRTDRWDIDGHHKVIGKEKDDAETCRMEARK